jgi:hypothetical protein
MAPPMVDRPETGLSDPLRAPRTLREVPQVRPPDPQSPPLQGTPTRVAHAKLESDPDGRQNRCGSVRHPFSMVVLVGMTLM